MNDAIGQVLALGVAVAISPIPIIGVVFMLSTPRARTTGPGFLLGWVAGLTAVGAVVLVASGGAGAAEGDAPATWVSWLKIGIGVLSLLLAAKQWRGRPRPGEEAELPSWMEQVDHFTFGRAAALGVGLSAVNPKNLMLTVAAAAAIAGTGATDADKAAALGVFVVIGTLGPAIPVAIYFVLGERAARGLDELKAWMAANGGAIMAVIFALIGAKLIGDGLGAL